MTRALILAGNGRTDPRWTSNPPRHLLPIGGEPLIHRTTRLLAERGITDIRVVADPTDTDYITPPATHEHPRPVDREWVQEWEPSRHLWNPHGTTMILYGDVYFTEQLLDAMTSDTGDPWNVYARFGGSTQTGKRYGEMFGWVVHSRHAAALTAAQAQVIDYRLRGEWHRTLGWEVYRVAMGRAPNEHWRGAHFQNWDDASDDFDTLEDWQRWATRNPDRR